MRTVKGTGKRLWRTAWVAGLVLILGGWSSVGATTYYVDQNSPSASDSGTGTQATPYKTINKGTSKAGPGDTVVVNAGRYYEAVSFAHSGTAANPITLMAAPGQHVIVDGAVVVPSASWTQCNSSYAGRNSNYANIYRATVSTQGQGYPYNLYQDDIPLAEAVWPATGWYLATGATSASPSSTMTDPVHLTQTGSGYWLGGRLIYFGSASNYFADAEISAYNPATGTLTIPTPNGNLPGDGLPDMPFVATNCDCYQIYDKLEDMTGPGQWAWDSLGNGSYALYVWPAGGGSPSSHVLAVPNSGCGIYLTSYSVINGLEVCHSNGHGLGNWYSPRNVTIENCCIHHNDSVGIYLLDASNVTIYHNYLCYNNTGVSALSNHGSLTIQENEIGWNGGFDQSAGSQCHGINLTGASTWSTGDVILHNYVHDHTNKWGHGDQIQTFGNVNNFLIESNFFLNCAMGYMINSTIPVATSSNDIWAECGAYTFESGINAWTFEHETVANGGFGLFDLGSTGPDIFYNNIFVVGGDHGAAYSINPITTSYTGDYNFFFYADGLGTGDWCCSSPVLWSSSGTTEWHWSWAQYQAGSGQDAHSIDNATNPQFVNAPSYFQGAGCQAFCTPSLVAMPTTSFYVGDHIEFDHDGVVRTVLSLGTSTATLSGTVLGYSYLTFTPSSANLALGPINVTNWRGNTNYVRDYSLKNTSPAIGKASDGSNMGSSISPSRMTRGDFSGAGARQIPSWPYAAVLLTVQVSPAAAGTVTVTPSQPTYTYGDTVQIQATPATAPFGGWTVTGGTVGSATASLTTLTISGNCTLTAYFTGVGIPSPLVTQVSPAGGGTVTVTPSQALYTPYTSVVSIQASASPGYYFVSWSATGGTITNAAAASTSLAITSSCTLLANFLPPEPVTTLVSPAGDGTVTVTPSQATYPPNTVVTIQATANTAWSFASWSVTGGTVSNATAATASLTITGSCTLTANLVPGYSGTEVGPGGTITVSNSGPYLYGTVFTASVSAQPGYAFSGWNITGLSTLSSSTALTTSVTVDGNFTLTANFFVSTPLNLSSVFNTEMWLSPAMLAACNAAKEAPFQLYGRETAYAFDMVGLNSDGEYPGYALPDNGQLTSPTDGHSYLVPSLTGNALYAGDQVEATNLNAIIVGEEGRGVYGSTYWVVPAVTMSVPQGNYSNINFVLAAGSNGASIGAAFIQIWAVYSTGASGLLYDFGSGGYRGPAFETSVSTTDADFQAIYTSTLGAWTNAPTFWGGTAVLGGASPPFQYYEFVKPRTLDSARLLTGIRFVDTAAGTGNTPYSVVELAIFAATITPTPVTVTVNQETGGTVTVSPSQATYVASNSATVTATAAPGYGFVSWSVTGGTISPSASQATLTVQGNVTLSASFHALSYTSTQQATGGTIVMTSSGPYIYGQVVGLTASANPGWLFTNWSVTGASLTSSTAATASLTVVGNFTLTANFSAITLAVSAALDNTWVYQNTPVWTANRQTRRLTVSVTDSSGQNASYVLTLSQSGAGVVTLTPTCSFTGSQTVATIIGGLRQADGVTGTGSCTILIQVSGNVGGQASTTVTLTVYRLGDVNQDGAVTAADLNSLNLRLDGLPTGGLPDANFDLTGDGSVTAADRVLLNLVRHGDPVP